MKLRNSFLAIAPVIGLLASCAQDSLTGDVYSRSQAGQAQSVQAGRITSIRPIKIEGENKAGALLGGVAGGVLGNQIGGSSRANVVGAVGGSLAGAAIGSHAQQAIGSRSGVEITVRLDAGGSVAVAQEVTKANPMPFSVGDRVKVISSAGRSRVTY
jgi:outer membrane lipoprotein SlyB